MNADKIKIINLETHKTKDIKDGNINGDLTPIWRDWDKIIPDPKMIYITSVVAGGRKGPHVHKKRTSCFVCIKGKVVFIIKDENGQYLEIESSEENPILIQVPKNIASAHVNLSKNESSVLTLADIAWKPNDNEMENVFFEEYNWSKWTI
jgi:dTDP-4-dehydrorhamnose 3,5-epimerase